MGRTRALAVAVLALAALGGLVRWHWPRPGPRPMQVGRQGEEGADVGSHAPEAAKLDLNQATESELARLPGVGRSAARSLVAARQARGAFRTWSEVDAVPGVGAARLEVLQQRTVLGQQSGP
jgi:competence protein ComEA